MQDARQQRQEQALDLDPAEIDCSQPWLFWPREPDELLIHSLQELGQLTPVLVRPGTARYELVTGYTRVQALSLLGRQVQALQVQGDQVRLGLIYMQANSGRSLQEQDLIQACRYFQFRVAEGILQDLLRTWLLPWIERRTWPLILTWLQLPSAWDQALACNGLPLEMGSRLLRLKPADWKELLPIFCKLSWSGNKARNLLDWLWEASGLTGQSTAEIVEELQLREVLEQGLSPKDAQEQILARVRKKRYPWLERLQEEFEALSRQLQGKYWRLSPEKNFETDCLYLQGKLRDVHELQAALEELQEMAVKQAWSELKQWQRNRFYPK